MTQTPAVATVDDDRRVRESIRSVLESAGFDAAMFASAEDFLASGLLTPQLGCVIVDVRLPGLDGVELQQRIRLREPLMPVIFVTAHDDDDIRARALQGGAVAFMVKPFDAAALIDTVERVTMDRH
jgi:FixJ family two-component response regulator